eukprot:1007451-Karenia_brevis.AAC.1
MALARLRLMPLDHPGARMLALADHVPACTWASTVKRALVQMVPLEGIPEIILHSAFSEMDISSARCSAEFRRILLRRYRDHVVRPALLQWDVAFCNQALDG